MNKNLITVTELSKKTGVSVSTLRTHLIKGRWPTAYKIGKTWVIPTKDIGQKFRIRKAKRRKNNENNT